MKTISKKMVLVIIGCFMAIGFGGLLFSQIGDGAEKVNAADSKESKSGKSGVIAVNPGEEEINVMVGLNRKMDNRIRGHYIYLQEIYDGTLIAEIKAKLNTKNGALTFSLSNNGEWPSPRVTSTSGHVQLALKAGMRLRVRYFDANGNYLGQFITTEHLLPLWMRDFYEPLLKDSYEVIWLNEKPEVTTFNYTISVDSAQFVKHMEVSYAVQPHGSEKDIGDEMVLKNDRAMLKYMSKDDFKMFARYNKNATKDAALSGPSYHFYEDARIQSRFDKADDAEYVRLMFVEKRNSRQLFNLLSQYLLSKECDLDFASEEGSEVILTYFAYYSDITSTSGPNYDAANKKRAKILGAFINKHFDDLSDAVKYWYVKNYSGRQTNSLPEKSMENVSNSIVGWAERRESMSNPGIYKHLLKNKDFVVIVSKERERMRNEKEPISEDEIIEWLEKNN